MARNGEGSTHGKVEDQYRPCLARVCDFDRVSFDTAQRVEGWLEVHCWEKQGFGLRLGHAFLKPWSQGHHTARPLWGHVWRQLYYSSSSCPMSVGVAGPSQVFDLVCIESFERSVRSFKVQRRRVGFWKSRGS